jgi:hypothetical protein
VSVGAYSQSFYRFTIGTSLTYIGDHDKFSYIDYDEITWNINTSISINKRLHIGVQALSIFADGGNMGYEYYHIIGGFLQYNFVQLKSVSFFIESSINTGNFYFSKYMLYPSKLNYLGYLGWGGGAEVLLIKNKRIFLDLSFISYHTLKSPEKCNAFTQYIIGINYKFGR